MILYQKLGGGSTIRRALKRAAKFVMPRVKTFKSKPVLKQFSDEDIYKIASKYTYTNMYEYTPNEVREKLSTVFDYLKAHDRSIPELGIVGRLDRAKNARAEEAATALANEELAGKQVFSELGEAVQSATQQFVPQLPAAKFVHKDFEGINSLANTFRREGVSDAFYIADNLYGHTVNRYLPQLHYRGMPIPMTEYAEQLAQKKTRASLAALTPSSNPEDYLTNNRGMLKMTDRMQPAPHILKGAPAEGNNYFFATPWTSPESNYAHMYTGIEGNIFGTGNPRGFVATYGVSDQFKNKPVRGLGGMWAADTIKKSVANAMNKDINKISIDEMDDFLTGLGYNFYTTRGIYNGTTEFQFKPGILKLKKINPIYSVAAPLAGAAIPNNLEE